MFDSGAVICVCRQTHAERWLFSLLTPIARSMVRGPENGPFSRKMCGIGALPRCNNTRFSHEGNTSGHGPVERPKVGPRSRRFPALAPWGAWAYDTSLHLVGLLGARGGALFATAFFYSQRLIDILGIFAFGRL